jgi:hypothetical protein
MIWACAVVTRDSLLPVRRKEVISAHEREAASGEMSSLLKGILLQKHSNPSMIRKVFEPWAFDPKKKALWQLVNFRDMETGTGLNYRLRCKSIALRVEWEDPQQSRRGD